MSQFRSDRFPIEFFLVLAIMVVLVIVLPAVLPSVMAR